LKRFIFLIIAASMFIGAAFAFAQHGPLAGALVGAGLIGMMVWGSRLEIVSAENKSTKQLKMYAGQANWSGAQLLVKPRWFKRFCVGLVLWALFYACTQGLIDTWPSAPKATSGYALLILAIFGFGYSALLVFFGGIREIMLGYSVKIDPAGITFAGYPAIPWEGVYRAGHSWQNNKGIIHHFLELDLNAELMHSHWPDKVRLFMWGPFFMAIPLVRHKGYFRIPGTFLTTPIPTIAAAIRYIGSKQGPHRVVEWNRYESLEDSRRLAELWHKAIEPVDDEVMAKAFANAAKEFAKPGGVIVQNGLDAAFETQLSKLTAKTDAFKEYSSASAEISERRSKIFLAEMHQGWKILNWIFGGGFLLVTVYFLILWIVESI